MEKYTLIVEQGEDGYFIGEVVELPGCHTQAKTLDALAIRAKEAIELYIEVKKPIEIKSRFRGIQQIEV